MVLIGLPIKHKAKNGNGFDSIRAIPELQDEILLVPSSRDIHVDTVVLQLIPKMAGYYIVVMPIFITTK
jgi:hypothetical protein